jgi:hypothetical protein
MVRLPRYTHNMIDGVWQHSVMILVPRKLTGGTSINMVDMLTSLRHDTVEAFIHT